MREAWNFCQLFKDFIQTRYYFEKKSTVYKKFYEELRVCRRKKKGLTTTA